jgi:hypothetical protein
LLRSGDGGLFHSESPEQCPLNYERPFCKLLPRYTTDSRLQAAYPTRAIPRQVWPLWVSACIDAGSLVKKSPVLPDIDGDKE